MESSVNPTFASSQRHCSFSEPSRFRKYSKFSEIPKKKLHQKQVKQLWCKLKMKIYDVPEYQKSETDDIIYILITSRQACLKKKHTKVAKIGSNTLFTNNKGIR